MRIDFHTHSKISSYLPFNKDIFFEKIKIAKQNELDAFVQLEHLHASDFFEFLDFLGQNYDYQNDYYIVDDIKIFVGVEITVVEKFDVVLIGVRDNVRIIAQKLIEKKNKENTRRPEIGVEELFEMCGHLKFMKILAHPYRKHEIVELSKKVIGELDAVELNANEVSNHGEDFERKRIENLAHRFNVPMVAGSDAHNPLRVGCVISVFKMSCNTIKEIKQKVSLCKIEVRMDKHG